MPIVSRREFLKLSGATIAFLVLPEMAAGREKPGIPVILYHDLSNRHHDSYTIAPGLFAAHMEWLYAHGYRAVFLDEAAALQAGDTEGVIVITFDDGYASFIEYAFTVLREYDFKATISVIGNHVGRHLNYEGNRPMLSWDEYGYLLASGHVQVACHSHGLHTIERMRNASPGEVEADLMMFQETMQQHVGKRAEILAWPYGIYYPERTAIAGKAGFSYILTSHEGYLNRRTDLSQIPRLTMTSTRDLALFQRYLEVMW
jgi:peptidoglycan/xylan/chitin deacetylase (PgdA/CDA1 family)